MREKNDFSSHRVSPFSRGVNFTRACVSPWEKMGTTRSLPVGKNAGVAKQISLSLKSSNSRVFFIIISVFLVELTPTLQWIHRIYVTVFRELSNLPQVTFQNGRFSGAMLALLTRKSSIIVPTHPYWRIYCMLFVSYYVLSFVLSLKIYRIFWVAQQMI